MEILDYQNSEARIRMNAYLIEHNLTGFKLLIETLLEEIEPVVTKKHGFEIRYKSIKINLRDLGLSGL